MKRILLLGGVTEALAIARTLGPQHVYSLAGVGRVPTDLRCEVRVGGYGGAEGLARYISEQGIDLLLDATHPYAAQISQNAALAAAASGIPCWALRRPAWVAQADDNWREVADWAELVEALKPFKRPLFTLGREPLEHLHEIPENQYWTLRALDVYPGNDRCEVIGARGPFLLDQERELFEQRQIDVLISKNSGSSATEPKLEVARERRVPVLILRRPELARADREFGAVDCLLNALKVENCGSGLARDGITAVRLTDRSACIAGKPAPTGFVAPTKFKLGREHCGSEPARDGITAVRLTDRSACIADNPHRFVGTTAIPARHFATPAIFTYTGQSG